MILIDTNIAIAILNGSSPDIASEFKRRCAGRDTVAVSSVVAFELEYGAARSTSKSFNEAAVRTFLASFVVPLPFDEQDAAHAGKLRAMLAAKGTPIGPYDLLIAGQALRHDAILATANLREFKRVPGLKCENWAR